VGAYPQLAKFDDFGPQLMETLNQAVDDLIFNMVLSVPGTGFNLKSIDVPYGFCGVFNSYFTC
jgi:hypothetical protein